MARITANLLQNAKKQLPQMVATFFLVGSLAYLLYHLLTFDQYDSLLKILWENTALHYWCLVGAILLLPFNLLMEAFKWKMMTCHIERISIYTALKAVLAGAATGFITPNRLGDIVGRTQLLKPENRNRALSLAITGSVTQNLAILLPGVPALMLFLNEAGPIAGISDSLLLLFYGLLAILLLALLPVVIALLRKKQNHKIHAWLSALDSGRMTNLLPILLLANARWCISCMQLWMFLMFAGIEINFAEAFTGKIGRASCRETV